MRFLGDTKPLESGLKAFLHYFKIELADTIEIEVLPDSSPYCLEIIKDTTCTIKYKKKHHFFRALSLYNQFVSEKQKSFTHAEKAYIPTCGTMIDCSRNAVYKVEKLQEFFIKLAALGQSTCMLYTEDTYEIPELPYFGYLRGRYSQAELKALDTFAYDLGIELVPCIQTLAHLRQTIKWSYAQGMKDTHDVLLVGAEKTYQFIESMFKSLTECFRTKRIHIGMDEAFDLGLGIAIEKYGYRHHSDLMLEHLDRVCALADHYKLEPMMWDDMFFRALTPHGNHYDTSVEISGDILERMPKNLTLVYWDYYHAEETFYAESLKQHASLNRPMIFAGGVWKWTGYAPAYDKTFITTNAALMQCKAIGMNEVFATMWGDDGAEAPLDCTLLGLILFTEHCYKQSVNDAWLDRRCRTLTGLKMKDFMLLQEVDLLPCVERPNLKCVNMSKYFLYQDILLGAFDIYAKDLDIYGYYSHLSEEYSLLSTTLTPYGDMFKVYETLSNVLALKATVGLQIKAAYDAKDKSTLGDLADHMLPTLQADLHDFKDAVAKVWFNDCKGQGFEIIDIRLSGIIGRCDTAICRLNAFIHGEIDCIEELDEEKLHFNFFDLTCEDLPAFNQYMNTASQSIMSHGV